MKEINNLIEELLKMKKESDIRVKRIKMLKKFAKIQVDLRETRTDFTGEEKEVIINRLKETKIISLNKKKEEIESISYLERFVSKEIECSLSDYIISKIW